LVTFIVIFLVAFSYDNVTSYMSIRIRIQ
jgi:hypothetical protein